MTENIVIDGVEHSLDKFSAQVRGMVNLREVWAKEMVDERSALTKTEAAIRQLDAELLEIIKKELTTATPEKENDSKKKKAGR